MNYEYLEFEIIGKKAMFSDPLSSGSGERCTLDIPTYEAIKGIAKNIYWKPTFIWVIDEVRIMNQISRGHEGVKWPNVQVEKTDRYNHTYLCNVRYQVRAHLEWNENRPEYKEDRNVLKHYEMARRKIEKGGNRPVYLGISDYGCYVYPCVFGSGEGFYDNSVERVYMNMYHSHTYPDEGYDAETRSAIYKNFDNIEMVNGVIRYSRPEDCKHRIFVVKSKMKKFVAD